METVMIKIEVPETILSKIASPDDEYVKELRLWAAANLYLQHKVSIGKAAELAGIPKPFFEDFLSINEIPISLLTYEDVKKDTKVIEALRSKL